MTRIDTIDFAGWPGCLQLTAGLQITVSTTFGPRILACNVPGGESLFYTDPAANDTPSDTFRLYGGHRLWHAPEHSIRTYAPDNAPVTVTEIDNGLRLTAPIEASTGIQKSIDIILSPDQPHARLIHRLTNHNLWPVTLSPWALTVFAPGGLAIAPLPPYTSHAVDKLPATSINVWGYTRLNDRRWTIGERYILLRTANPEKIDPQKIGLYAPAGWLAYARLGQLFIKRVHFDPAATYPDRNSNLELFTDNRFTELETLAPLQSVPPGDSATHCETWRLFTDIAHIATEADVRAHVLPRLPALQI